MLYEIQLPVFEGPFDLLLHLIRHNQVDIYDIPIELITDQYLEYLSRMEQMDLDIASSFIVMAATLLAIKAKMLLPAPPDEEDEEPEDARSELVRDLMEYLSFKEAAQTMDELASQQQQYYARPNEEELYLNLFSDENPLTGKTLDDLRQAFSQVIAKAEQQGLVMHIEREQITLADRLEYLHKLIVAHQDGVTFSTVFASCSSKMAMIVTFLALLELIRQSVVRISQTSSYAEIYLYPGDLSKYDQDAV
jgi:segregation and condensation protein A